MFAVVAVVVDLRIPLVLLVVVVVAPEEEEVDLFVATFDVEFVDER